MKRLTWIIAMAVVGMSAFHTHAQETVRERIQRQQPAISTSSPLASSSLRAEQLGRYSSFDPDNAKWLRVVYRYLDLSDDRNAPLYYPVQPEPGRTNFFTSIFRLLSEGKIDAYEYVDGNEVFADNYKIDFREFLDRFGIYYEVQDSRIVVNDADIPSGEVTGYYVKEAYFFDSVTSSFGIRTLAVCPILVRKSDFETSPARYPLFWIPYSEIQPFALQMQIMTSSLNNVINSTVDDFFRMHRYNGEIYKTLNLQGKTLAEIAPSPEALKAEQEKIEKQLKDFEDHLWKQDTAIPTSPTGNKAKKTKNPASSDSGSPTVSMRDRRF